MSITLQNAGQPYAIVIGLDCITGLQTARILARHRVPVVAIAKDLTHYCCRTKVCEAILPTNTASDDLIRTLENLGPQLQHKAVLFPCTDMSVLLISRHRQRLQAWYHVILPEPDVVEMLVDKISFCTYAQKEGLSIPGTFFLHSKADAEAAAQQLSFPCILKPPVKTPDWEQQSKAKVYKVSSPEAFLALYERCSSWAEILMVQEWIEGGDDNLYSCNCYFGAHSQPFVTFIARKLRQWPPETGTSCLGEECRNDIVLHESLRLFRSVGYRGLGYVEMKRDQRSGKHFIIEPNIGRPTGRSAIAEAGGVELLYTMYCDALGWPLPKNREQTYKGVKWLDLRRDFQSAMYYWRRGELTLKQWWQSWRGQKAHAVFSLNDPAPFVAELRRAAGLSIASFKRRIKPARSQHTPQPKVSILERKRLLTSYPRALLMTFDAIVTAPLRPKQSNIEHIRLIINRKSREFDRAPSLINLLDSIMPGFSRYMSGILYTSRRVPFNNECIKAIDYGTGVTVFLLWNDKSKVVKIYRKSLGRSSGDVLKIVNEFRRKYEIISSWYNNISGLVPHAEFLILHGPVLGAPAAAVLQPYVCGVKRDFFYDFSDEELVELMRNNDDLKSTFVCFAKVTIDLFLKGGMIIDLIGRNNLMLVQSANIWTLVTVDNGIFDLKDIRLRQPQKLAQIEEHISRMENLLRRVTNSSDHIHDGLL